MTDPDAKKLHPLLVDPMNFTPQSRTPWGGRKLVEWKKRWNPPEGALGESWEVSFEPSFPSTVNGTPLEKVVRENPKAWLGEECVTGTETGAHLLVKLIDTQEPLSVQIHPSNNDPNLKIHESGKPEAWLILDHEPGAGIYMGFKEHVTRFHIEEALEEKKDFSTLLHFVPVKVGDFFLIEAGIPHAIGKGITLLEPQKVVPAKVGVTYRYWDWNRLYHGQSRELHVTQATLVTSFGKKIKHNHISLSVSETVCSMQLCGQDHPSCDSNDLWVRVVQGKGKPLPMLDRPRLLVGMTCIEGEVRGIIPGKTIYKGETVVIPADADLEFDLDGIAVFCAAYPDGFGTTQK